MTSMQQQYEQTLRENTHLIAQVEAMRERIEALNREIARRQDAMRIRSILRQRDTDFEHVQIKEIYPGPDGVLVIVT